MTLTKKLVLGIVAILTFLSIVIGLTSVLVLRHFLIERLDGQLANVLERVEQVIPRPQDDRPPGIGDAQGAGTLGLLVRDGRILAPKYLDDNAQLRTLSRIQQLRLLAVESRDPTTVQLGGKLGNYRVASKDGIQGGRLIVGLPMRDVEVTTLQLAGTLTVVAILGISIAGLIGTIFVRRSMKPLATVAATASKVSELSLDRGEVELLPRVPDGYANSNNEVGQVGIALNRLLDRVSSALAARQASERKVRQFVADASHELRTPLASIRGYSELTRRSGVKLDPDLSKALSRIESESIRMTGLVEDLLLLARLDEHTELQLGRMDLLPLCRNVFEDSVASSSNHRWAFNASSEPIWVNGDPDRLHQAIGNLLANARIHTPEGSQIELNLAVEGTNAIIKVTDDGPGIPESIVPMLFERFIRADSSRSRKAGGSGLGLSISRAIFEEHNGTLTVKSKPGLTVFTGAIPLASDQ